MTARLRSVGPDDKPVRRRKPAPLTVSQAAKTGTLRELLVATRDRIALAVENETTPARELATLTKRLMETVHEIEAIDQREKASDANETSDGSFDASAI